MVSLRPGRLLKNPFDHPPDSLPEQEGGRRCTWGSGVPFARRGRLSPGSEVEVDSQVSPKCHVASDAEGLCSLARGKMGSPRQTVLTLEPLAREKTRACA